MLEYLNAAACVALMGYSLPVAMIMGNRGMWWERMSVVAVQLGLFMQMTNPWVAWTPSITWPSVYLNVAAVLLLTVWWRRAWIFVRNYLGPVDTPLERKRRRTDWAGVPQHSRPPAVARFPQERHTKSVS